VLDSAANEAAAQPPLPALGPGQYYYQKKVVMQNCSFELSDPDGSSTQIDFVSPIDAETWTALDGSGLERNTPIGSGHFQTPEEQSIWQASGEPNECIETTNTETVPPSTPDDPGVAMLPSDPNILANLIAAGRVDDAGRVSPGNGHCPSQNGDADQVVPTGAICNVAAQFDIVNNLLGSPEAAAKLGPVLYRILAQLPGVEIIGSQTDAIGRSGTAIEDPSSGDVVVLDSTTGTLLETETLATTKVFPGVSPGTVLQSVTFATVGIVGSAGSVPG
jgi:hypothetical protein